MRFLILNGPNINFIGIREPAIYGKQDFKALEKLAEDTCRENGIECELFQSNHEGALIDRIQQAYMNTDGIVFNPGGYTHTSIAIMDALKAVGIPCVEVHISDVDSREEFRRHSYIALASVKTIKGQGLEGYRQAILFLKDYLEKRQG